MLKYLNITFCLVVLFLSANPARAFQGPGCAADCKDCHSISMDEADKILKTAQFEAKVKDIKISPVKGLWEVELAKGSETITVYLDFAKKYLVRGQFLPVADIGKPAPLTKVDTKKIPLSDALVLGNKDAKTKIIVFDDPDCPFCKKLHEEIRKIIEKNKDISFLIKLYPLPIHKEAYDKSKAILCEKSVKLLDDAFAGKVLPKPKCAAKEIDENIKLAGELGIRGTPAIILPDGRLIPGYVDADTLLKILESPPL
ncbi:MAG: DsbC family protein [Deltaproteobacteria bacterium]|nr:DsbC family protein [Deltaproteobacteria bacterium]